MIYSPIIIPTLNRIKHLRRCIDSLKKNDFAKHSDLFISVDFPPENGLFSEGYEEVCNYVKTIKGFKNIYTFFQNNNLGPGGNSDFLISRIMQFGYDRYIYTEDDNEFSPNFLEYIDKGLEKFENDPSIIAICGSTFITGMDGIDNTFYVKPAFSARGFGTWIEKIRMIGKTVDNDYFEKFYRSLYTRYKVFCLRPNVYQAVSLDAMGDNRVIRDAEGNIRFIDDVWNLYCITENRYSVFPVVNLVRNWGHDGSGVNCGIIEKNPEDILIDKKNKFFYRDKDGVKQVSEKILRKELKTIGGSIDTVSLIRAIIVVVGKVYLSDSLFDRLKLLLHRYTMRKNQ